MLTLLTSYEEDGYLIEKYTRDGETVSHVVRTPIIDESTIEEAPTTPTIEEKILYETQYQTMLIETSMSF